MIQCKTRILYIVLLILIGAIFCQMYKKCALPTMDNEQQCRSVLLEGFSENDSLYSEPLKDVEVLVYTDYVGEAYGYHAKSVSSFAPSHYGDDGLEYSYSSILYLTNGTHEYKVKIGNMDALHPDAKTALRVLQDNLDAAYRRSYDSDQTHLWRDTLIQVPLPVCAVEQTINLAKCQDLPFFLLDVTFSGHPSLLVKQPGDGPCQYFTVCGLREDDNVNVVDFPPYDEFKTATGSWMVGSGTIIDYDKKQIRNTSVEPGSCADYGAIIHDTYTMNSSTRELEHTRSEEKYDFNE
jgi:hypothetical protein